MCTVDGTPPSAVLRTSTRWACAHLGWMENNFEKRIDPTVLVPGAKSVVTVIGSYRFQENEEWDRQADRPKIAKYARGRDYHKVFKGKLKQLLFYTRDLVERESDV